MAQNNDSISFIDIDIQKNAMIYHLAMQFNDPTIAKMALYNLLFYSNNQSAVLDSMAMTYYNLNQMPSVALITQENLRINPNNEVALEMGGIALNKLGAKDQALVNYEKLFLKNNHSRTLYEVALLQFELRRNEEASTSLEILSKRNDIDEIKIVFAKTDKSQQDITMRAAALNIRGLIAQQSGYIQKAKEYFLAAIKASPGFELAQLNLSKAGKEGK
jgi:tetratricopeptide (TPR) repeat protein